MPIEAILFDKDGTLIDFNATFAPATHNVIMELAERTKAAAYDIAEVLLFDLEKTVVKPGSVLLAGSVEDIAQYIQQVIDQDDGLESLTTLVDELYIKHTAETVTPFDFLKPTLSKLTKMGLLLGVATNDSEAAARSHLGKIGANEEFAHIYGSDSGFGAKPNPGMIIAFSEALGLSPDKIAMVGDTLHDCEAGRASGSYVIGVTTGHFGSDQLAPHCDIVLDDISFIPEHLEETK